jgi:ketosteroid isomerase-like protein
LRLAVSPGTPGRDSDCVAIARALYEATDRRDLDAVLRVMAEDVEIISAATHAGVPQIEFGHEGVRRLWRRRDALDIRPRVIVHRLFEIDGCVLSHYTVATARGDAPLGIAETIWGVVAVNEEGKMAASWSYDSEHEARAALPDAARVLGPHLKPAPSRPH